MEDLNDKITGNNLTADEWNQVPSEIQNVIEESGIALSSGDVTQQLQAIYNISRRGLLFVDSGAADAYVLTSSQSQPATEYRDGMMVIFVADNDNTGASTVNVDGLGLQTITDGYGSATALTGGEISGLATLIYDGTNFGIYSLGAASNAVYANNTSVEFRDVGDTTDVGVVSLNSSDELDVGDVGFNTNIVGLAMSLTTPGIMTLNPTGALNMVSANAAVNIDCGTGFTLRVNDTENAIVVTVDAEVALYHNAISSLKTQEKGTGTQTTGAQVLDGVGFFKDVGMNVMPVEDFSSTNINLISRAKVGFYFEYDGAGAATAGLGLETNIPVGATWVIANNSSDQSDVTIDTEGATLRWLDGSGSAAQTGDRTLAASGVATLMKHSTDEFRIWGSGLS